MALPQSRQQTRAAILQHLLTVGDCFRGGLVHSLGRTEAGISRIGADVRAEALDALRGVMLDAIDASVLGGLRGRGIEVAFIPPSIGNDPFPAICFAA